MVKGYDVRWAEADKYRIIASVYEYGHIVYIVHPIVLDAMVLIH